MGKREASEVGDDDDVEVFFLFFFLFRFMEGWNGLADAGW